MTMILRQVIPEPCSDGLKHVEPGEEPRVESRAASAGRVRSVSHTDTALSASTLNTCKALAITAPSLRERSLRSVCQVGNGLTNNSIKCWIEFDQASSTLVLRSLDPSPTASYSQNGEPAFSAERVQELRRRTPSTDGGGPQDDGGRFSPDGLEGGRGHLGGRGNPCSYCPWEGELWSTCSGKKRRRQKGPHDHAPSHERAS